MDAKTLMSVEEFDRLEEPDELSYELDEGELVVMTKPRPLHNRIAERLFRALDRYLETHPGRRGLQSSNICSSSAPTSSARRMFRSSGRSAPNRSIRTPTSLVRRTWPSKCFLPHDTVSAMRRKIRQYFAAGAQCVWIVYPETREVEVWKREAAKPQEVLQETDLLEAPDLLPGFSLRVGALFG